MKSRIHRKLPEVQETTSYRWDRILFIAVVFLLLVSGIVWGIWYWGSVTNDEVVIDDVALEEPHIQPGIVAPEEHPDSVSLLADDTAREQPVYDSPFADNATSELAEDTPTPVEDSADVLPLSDNTESEPSAVAEEEIKDEKVAETQVVEENAAGVAPVTIHSGRILRAGVSELLEDKELIGKLPATVQMNDKGLLRIYFFNEIADMVDQQYYHDWYFNDKRQARVSIKPFISPMRASTGKYVERTMLGSWRVEAVTQDGEVLAEARFEVVE